MDHYYGRLMKLVAENNGLKVFGAGKFIECDFRLENEVHAQQTKKFKTRGNYPDPSSKRKINSTDTQRSIRA